MAQAALLWDLQKLREGHKQKSHFSLSQREGNGGRLIGKDSSGHSPKGQVWKTQAERQWENRAEQSSAYSNKQACHRNQPKSCFQFWSRNLTGRLPSARTLLGRSGTKMKKTPSPVPATDPEMIIITQEVQEPCQAGSVGAWTPARMG